jgi:hypothetical protein
MKKLTLKELKGLIREVIKESGPFPGAISAYGEEGSVEKAVKELGGTKTDYSSEIEDLVQKYREMAKARISELPSPGYSRRPTPKQRAERDKIFRTKESWEMFLRGPLRNGALDVLDKAFLKDLIALSEETIDWGRYVAATKASYVPGEEGLQAISHARAYPTYLETDLLNRIVLEATLFALTGYDVQETRKLMGVDL